MYKIDLHTHSHASPDGALKTDHYRKMLESGDLDYIAVTDHNTITAATQLQKELGDHIIVGEEITTTAGEIIGLYLKKVIPAHLSLSQTVSLIHDQRGLVYIPHPFETVRQGVTLTDLQTIAAKVDIIETHNGRSLQNRSSQTIEWATAHKVPGAASSDAHGWHGWGKTYSLIKQPPTDITLPELLRTSEHQLGSPGVRGRLYPKANRLRRRLKFV
jgi:predicted metal-dependent phosphoesterase TrpH